jgi:dolichyl-phosphate beta-glucosyltransferase
MELSVVIPVYNEEQKIRHDIIAASNFLSSYKISGEIIVVDDGSSDRTSEAASQTTVDEGISLKVIDSRVHNGKGYAVKTGMLEAAYGMVMFIDSGNCVPYANILRGMELLQEGTCEIAHGSRFLTRSMISHSRKPYRKLASFLFRKYIRLHSPLLRDLTDTQCGLKIYPRGIAHELYKECITSGFMFDIEIILRARKKGYRIMEFPIEWTSDPDSRLSVSVALPEILRELRIIRKALK